jgi:hypothetical protein
MRWRAAAERLGLAFASVLAAVGALESGLRLAGYRFAPVVILEVDGSRDTSLIASDPELLWRPDPAAWADMGDDGVRAVRAPRKGERILLALGDGNTLGSPGAGEHWTAELQELLDRNAGEHPWRVLNAGCPGWTSLQGLRRFGRLADRHPAVVLVGFGANEAVPAFRPDEVHARRADWTRRLRALRLAAPVAQRVWGLLDGDGGPPAVARVSPEAHRRNLEDLVEAAQAHAVLPVLVTRPHQGPGRAAVRAYRDVEAEVASRHGIAVVDPNRELADRPEAFDGEWRLSRGGRRRLAILLLRRLKTLGQVPTDFVYASAVEPGRLEAARTELGRGWWDAEPWAGGGSGRWTAAEADLVLERHADEDRLDVDLSLLSPTGRTRGRIEVGGRPLAAIDAPNGPWRRSLDVSSVPEREVTVRFVTDTAFVPRASSPGATDARTLGVFVRAVALSTSGPRAADGPGRIR